MSENTKPSRPNQSKPTSRGMEVSKKLAAERAKNLSDPWKYSKKQK